jgi:hypothetical protein
VVRGVSVKISEGQPGEIPREEFWLRVKQGDCFRRTDISCYLGGGLRTIGT